MILSVEGRFEVIVRERERDFTRKKIFITLAKILKF